ncbi:hypothetical protein ACJ41O_009182 [Fusarium nematophilum]
MLKTGLIASASLIALLSIYAALRPATPPSPPTPGLKNTVLFITDSANGLSNVHLATALALSSYHSSLALHYASFAALKPSISRISSAAASKSPDSKPIIFHELPPPDLVTTFDRAWGNVSGIASPPGLKGIGKLTRDVQILLAPWEAEEHLRLYRSITDIIENVDPAIVVLDSIFRPGVEATQDANRLHMFISPNSLTDSLAHKQPWGAMFWKYPPIGSGHPYPVPWHLIPTNIYLQLRMIHAALVAPNVRAKRSYLSERGIKNPLDVSGVHRPSVPWLTMALPEASLPMAVMPPGAKHCGPIVLETAPLQEQDAEMAAWLRRAPTMLVNLGSAVMFEEDKARSMVEAFVPVLERTDVQILWKMKKLGGFDDSLLEPVREHVASGRLRIESWIKADPTALLATGDVKLSVHHGGANCYHEAILYGVPQVVLPIWFDLYNYASTAEYLGVGIWPTKDTAPGWNATSLSQCFLSALTGVSGEAMRKKAKKLGEIARQYEGSVMAAREVAAMAAKGHD